MSYSHVQGKTHSGQSGTTLTLSFDAAVTSGNSVTAAVGWVGTGDGSDTVTSATDDKGNNYPAVRSLFTGGYYWVAIKAVNLTNGPTTLTISISSTGGVSFGVVVGDEWGGTASNYGVNASAAAASTGTAVSSGTFTGEPGDLLIGYVVNIGSTGITAGQTQAQNVISTWLSEYATAAGTQAMTATNTTSANWAIIGFALGAPPAYSHVQGKAHTGQSGTTLTLTFDAPVTSGNSVTAAIGWAGTAGGADTVTSATDDKGNNYPITTSVFIQSGIYPYYWFGISAENLTNSPTTLTVQVSSIGGVTFGAVIGDEWGGTGANYGVNGSAAAANNGNPLSSGNVTANLGNLLVGYGVNTGSNGISGDQRQAQNVASSFLSEYATAPSGGQAMTGTNSVGGQYWLMIGWSLGPQASRRLGGTSVSAMGAGNMLRLLPLWYAADRISRVRENPVLTRRALLSIFAVD
jgi:hypothetical protein